MTTGWSICSILRLTDVPRSGLHQGLRPGVRENGGQYTHAAIWAVMGFAMMGETERAGELFGMLNPIHHISTPRQAAVYKVEPYVVAADVYAVAPHEGRGGWTWYTGSAGWLQRPGVESILGLRLRGPFLSVDTLHFQGFRTSTRSQISIKPRDTRFASRTPRRDKQRRRLRGVGRD